MAIVKTKIIGKLPRVPGLVFYRSGGQVLVRAKTSVDKKRIMTDPAYENVRRHNAIFGQAARINKRIRMALGPLVDDFGDSTLLHRFQKIFREIVRRHHVRLEDMPFFELRYYTKELKGFNIGPYAYTNIYRGKETPVHLNDTGTLLEWDIRAFGEESALLSPNGATHFKLVLAGLKVPSSQIFEEEKADPYFKMDIDRKVAESEMISLEKPKQLDTPLRMELENEMALGDGDSLMVLTGIIFYQDCNGEVVQLFTNQVMVVAEVL